MNKSVLNEKVLTNFKKLKSFLFSEYDLFNGWKKRVLLTLILFVFTVLILMLFQPFGLGMLNSDIKLSLILKYAGYPLLVWFFVLSAFSFFWRNSFTILKSILLLLILVVISGFTTHFVWAYDYTHSSFNWYLQLHFQKMALITGFIPILIMVAIHSNYVLKKRLTESKALNDSIRSQKESISKETIVEIFSKEQNKRYTFQSHTILYIQSQDNYIKVVTDSNLKDELIRVTLSNAHEQIKANCSHIFRCHNSYIVNIEKVKHVEGNSAGYKLFLDNATIPVSRKYVPVVKSKII